MVSNAHPSPGLRRPESVTREDWNQSLARPVPVSGSRRRYMGSCVLLDVKSGTVGGRLAHALADQDEPVRVVHEAVEDVHPGHPAFSEPDHGDYINSILALFSAVNAH